MAGSCLISQSEQDVVPASEMGSENCIPGVASIGLTRITPYEDE